MNPVLQLDRLTVQIGAVSVVDDISFNIYPGQTFALLGESGSGKSMSALAIMGLLPSVARQVGGHIRLNGADMDLANLRDWRGGRAGMVFQEPMTSLNPVMTVGDQIAESLRLHRGLTGKPARAEVAALLSSVGVPDAERRVDAFPFQLSGGLKQRVMIALSLAGNPSLLIADEPTTALDVTVQAQVLALLQQIQQQRQMGLLLITHDLGVAWGMADEVGVMYAGRLVEMASRDALFAQPAHPYTRKLLAALPQAGQQRLASISGGDRVTDSAGCPFAPRCELAMPCCQQSMPNWTVIDNAHRVRCHAYPRIENKPPGVAVLPPRTGNVLLQARGIKVQFAMGRSVWWRAQAPLNAVDGIDLELRAGEAVALVGESGCGKSTLARVLAGLQTPTDGQVFYPGVGSALARRQLVQMVFQDPFASLDPRMRVDQLIAEGMLALRVSTHVQDQQIRLKDLMAKVGLPESALVRYPHEFSGGQRQRIAIARALAVNPALLVCDEPTSALDVSVQAQIVNLLADIQREAGVGLLFVTHNLPLAGWLAQRILVMYLGKIVESGPADLILRQPAHPYTRALLDAVPEIGRLPVLSMQGEPASAVHPPSGCHFHPRCPMAQPDCRTFSPDETVLVNGVRVRCHFPTGV